ncbi:GDSL esterase/lipase At1g71691-like [Durio zibethinus]|uniref:GDSL esterase/lipase At1g71691-like n=1 Tax=Durio zibethinus TaxID=66656 RepID=A0A6P5YCY6_DURZI|nr:GDSL esterase/lipase At1g71691-like [Durio zibethinus]
MVTSLLVIAIFFIISSHSKALRFPQELYNLSLNEIFIVDSPSGPPSTSASPTPLLSPTTPAVSSPLVPALFIIGDSTVDCGNNNFLGTFARADHPPYGRDFDTHQPTGRFCNGRIPVDYLALHLGLPIVPSYLGQEGELKDMLHGINYASAAAGIIFSSGSELGQHISFTHQIQQFADTYQQFVLSMGEDVTIDFISSSVLYISIGTNDYIHYYLRNVSNVQNLYLPWGFNQFLASTMRQEIKNLYNMNVRRLVVMGLPPIGCAPYYLWRYKSNSGECIEEINNMIMEFNFVMRYMTEELLHELPDARIIFCDVFQGSMDIIQNHKRYGFNATTDACCGLGKYKGWIMCMSGEMACPNASNHIWWDQFHPTDAVNAILADNVWSSRHTEMCYPMNLEKIVVDKPE